MAWMLARRAVLGAVVLSAACVAAVGQRAAARETRDYLATGAPIKAEPVDREIAAALKMASVEKIRSNIETLVQFKNRSTIGSVEKDLPAGTGVLAASDWIKAQFEAYSKACGGCLEVKVDEFVQQPEAGFGNTKPRIAVPTTIRNVYAILKGSDPAQAKRMYLVTGHYDTRVNDVMDAHDFAPGANDDSSGTAVSLESARVLSGQRFPATIVFVAVAGEEQGLNGSRHLAKLARAEGWQLEGVLNNDIVGGDTTPGEKLANKGLVRVFSQGLLPSAPVEELRAALAVGAENDTASRELARTAVDVARTYFGAGTGPARFTPVMEMRLDRYLRGGDHSSFSAEGFAAVRFTEWRENFDHQHQKVRVENGVEYGDLLKFDDFNYIAQVARMNMATLATLARSPGVPQNVRVVTKNLDNNTTLKWEAPLAGGVEVRYQILWRETSAGDWQFVGDAAKYADSTAGPLAATLPVSKDNVFFGLRACDGAGHCSEAVAPVPERR